jgi:hypothetical protein
MSRRAWLSAAQMPFAQAGVTTWEAQAGVGTNPAALDAWKDITPLARNECICWVEDAK